MECDQVDFQNFTDMTQYIFTNSSMDSSRSPAFYMRSSVNDVKITSSGSSYSNCMLSGASS